MMRFLAQLTWLRLALILGLTFSLGSCTAIQSQLEPLVLDTIRRNPEVILEAVGRYQQEQQASQQASRFSAFAQNPGRAIGDSPVTGGEVAAETGEGIILYEFSDFQCPFCGRVQDTLKTFMAAHDQDVTLVFKHFPLTAIHPEAQPAAQAAWAAQQQGKFWEYHDALFTNQDSLDSGLYERLARELGLDLRRFRQDKASEAAAQAVEADLQLGQLLGVSGTPFFLMNDRPLSGAVPLAQFEATLAELQAR